MKAKPRHRLRPALMAGAITAALGVGGTAWAYWADSGTLTTGSISTAISVPMPTLTCTVPANGYNQQATWGMPAGYQADSYRVVMTYNVPGTWQRGSTNGPAASIWGDDKTTNGTYYYYPDPQGITTDTWAAWGVSTPSLSWGQTQNNSGTLYVYARIGTWESEPATAIWHVNYDEICNGAEVFGACVGVPVVEVSLADCTVTASG